MQMRFTQKYIHTGDIYFSIGMEEDSGRFFIGITISHGPAEYERLYEIDKETYDLCPSNIDELEVIAKECFDKKRENTLFFGK